MEIQTRREKEDKHAESLAESRPLSYGEPQRKPVLGAAEQILAGTQRQGGFPYPQSEREGLLSNNPYLFGAADVGTLSRSMTSLGLSNTIPEEPSDVDLESNTLMHARRIASKSAIDLVGLNENEVFDATAPLPGELESYGMTESNADNGISFSVTMMPSRSIIISNLSPLLNDDYVRVLFQTSGDVQTVRTEYRMQGIVQVVYYDIRSAMAAKEQLNGLTVANQILSVQFVTTPGSVGSFTEGTLLVFGIDPSLDVQQVTARFSVYGNVKRVLTVPDRDNCRLIEFYDLRHAHAAMEKLNKNEVPKSPGLPTGMKQTMSLQQLAGGNFDQEEDMSSRSWDGSAQAVQQMEELMKSSKAVASPQLHAVKTGVRKSTSFGSGLADYGRAEVTSDISTSRAVQLTPELAEGLKLSDSASSLGTVFPGQTQTGLGKLQSGFGTGGLFGISNSSSVGSGLDTYAQHSLVSQGIDSQFHSQQPSFHQGLGFGQAPLPQMQGFMGTPTAQNPALLTQPGYNNLLQTIAAAQAAGYNIYDILARLPGTNMGSLPQMMSNHRGINPSTPVNASILSSLTSANTARLAALQSLQTASPVAATLSSPNYGAGSGAGLDQSNMYKSASSPVLNASVDDRDAASHRFGGRLSRRNVDPVIEAERRAQQQRLYALDLDKIRRKEDKRTTLMIKNIPNKYTQKMLLASIDETLRGTYDFFYLPIDFKNKCNVGYGFINMREPEDIIPLVERFHNKKWERFNSEKICCVAYGRIQGKQALINHFQNSSLMHEDKKHRPVLFVTDGPHKGEPESFPVGSNVRPKITLKERDFRSRERSGHWA